MNDQQFIAAVTAWEELIEVHAKRLARGHGDDDQDDPLRLMYWRFWALTQMTGSMFAVFMHRANPDADIAAAFHVTAESIFRAES